ncbi:phage tail family protein (plasmid) [Cytobacillus spongiae]|uniref:distal tail protein Dit n=1 Tax=Cytobacillus spongiae TaxID=2901381 RepID=UPI001F3DEA24|nr:distal tail protein Dit [Cytobacillus spongiae]UII58123.1 phage tail family protein [Cytobacillus spongiae]
MLFSFSFDGEKKDYIICGSKRRSAFAPIKRNLLYLPNRPGALLESTTREIRVIEQPITINGKDRYDVRKLEEEISDWLIKDEEKSLVFDDEPNREYFAYVDGSLDIEDIVRFGKGVITFICLDPNKYGSSHNETFTGSELSAPINLVNNGTNPSYPHITITLSGPTTLLDIIGDEDYMRIGKPMMVDETPFEKYETIWSDDGITTVGWATAGYVPDGGVNSGAMSAANGEFYASSYGSGASWHGPALAKSIGSVLSDYVARAYFDVSSSNGSQRGRAEVYLLDASNKIIGKVAAVIRKSTGEAEVEIALRNGAIKHYVTSMDWTYKNFYGYLDIIKEGTSFIVSVAQHGNDGTKVYTRHKQQFPYLDINNRFQNDLAAIGIHTATHGSSPATKAAIRKIEVDRINQKSKGVPYIGKAGDVFEFIMEKDLILKNGEPFMKKDFGSRFFQLKPGNNFFVLNSPNVIAEFNAKWRDPYK